MSFVQVALARFTPYLICSSCFFRKDTINPPNWGGLGRIFTANKYYSEVQPSGVVTPRFRQELFELAFCYVRWKDTNQKNCLITRSSFCVRIPGNKATLYYCRSLNRVYEVKLNLTGLGCAKSEGAIGEVKHTYKYDKDASYDAYSICGNANDRSDGSATSHCGYHQA